MIVTVIKGNLLTYLLTYLLGKDVDIYRSRVRRWRRRSLVVRYTRREYSYTTCPVDT